MSFIERRPSAELQDLVLAGPAFPYALTKAKMWSIYSTLYSDLPQSIASALSSYVRLYRIGNFTSAEELFVSDLQPHQQRPVVCVERAVGLFSQGRLSAVRSFVDEMLNFGQLEDDQQKLLELIKGFATVGSHGSLFAALCRTRKLRTDLALLRWDDLSFFQVSYIFAAAKA